MVRSAIWVPVLFLALVATGREPAVAQELTTVLIVRHTEKAADEGDPPLSAAGRERAVELARLAGKSGVSVLFATQYLRTRQTLSPVAEELGLEIREHDARDSEGLARRILDEHAGAVVLVAGHSNTVPAIVAALGAPEPDPIADWQYDDLFVVSAPRDGPGATVLHLKFGRPTPGPD